MGAYVERACLSMGKGLLVLLHQPFFGGPGCPGNGGGNCARRRMMATGSEKNWLFSAGV